MPLAEHLSRAEYRQPISLRGYNRNVTVLSALTAQDAAKVLQHVMPGLTRAEHQHLAGAHEAEARRQSNEWSRLADEASMETFGRPFGCFADYKISGIARSEYSEEKKRALRFAAHAEGNHRAASRAHAWAARHYR